MPSPLTHLRKSNPFLCLNTRGPGRTKYEVSESSASEDLRSDANQFLYQLRAESLDGLPTESID
jgi:hypothetical protein